MLDIYVRKRHLSKDLLCSASACTCRLEVFSSPLHNRASVEVEVGVEPTDKDKDRLKLKLVMPS